MKGKTYKEEYPENFSFRINKETKNFIDMQKLREFSITKPYLQQILKELLWVEKATTKLKKIMNGKAYK